MFHMFLRQIHCKRSALPNVTRESDLNFALQLNNGRDPTLIADDCTFSLQPIQILCRHPWSGEKGGGGWSLAVILIPHSAFLLLQTTLIFIPLLNFILPSQPCPELN
jgi:hypothetical protein